MKTFSLLGCLGLIGLTSTLAVADPMSPREASKRIREAVEGIEPLALSGVQTFKVKSNGTIREMLFELALQEQYSSDDSDFSWVGKSAEAWDADSTNWGETDMKTAYHYVMDPLDDEDHTEDSNRDRERNLRNAKKAFQLLLNTGVKFGVAPMGAVQCGVTFAALAVIDPHSRKIYLFKKEGSGC